MCDIVLYICVQASATRLQSSPPNRQLLWLSFQRSPLRCYQVAIVNHWQPGGDVLATSCNTVTTVGDLLATHLRCRRPRQRLALGDFFKQFEKVAKRLRGLATIGDDRQCTGNLLAIYWRSSMIRAMWWQLRRNHRLPQHSQHVASTISARVKGADRLATEK